VYKLTPIEIKDYIVENNKQIEILEKLECHHVKESKKYFTCGRPNGQRNNFGIQLYKQSLKVVIYTPDLQNSKHYQRENADILTLIMIIRSCSFAQANRWIHEQLGLKYTPFKLNKDEPKKESPLDIFTKHKKRRICNVHELDMIDNEILNDFIPYIHIDWVRDGILPNIAEEFGIGYSEKKKRIVIPHRLWCGSKDDYVGIVGRTTLSDDLIELFDVPKYFPIIAYPKSLNLYGLNENYQGIQSKNYTVVFEAEKSVLKRASRLDRTGTAVCCHSISEEQVKILIGLNVEIIIAFDSDVPIEIIREECEKFYGIRTVSYMFDKYGLLKFKQSPADVKEEIYQYLFNYRVRYDEKEHRKYIEWKEGKDKVV
jgi:DNA primase